MSSTGIGQQGNLTFSGRQTGSW